MLLFCLVWVASQAEYFLSSGQSLFKAPERLLSNFPAKMLSVVNRPPHKSTSAWFQPSVSSSLYSTYSPRLALLTLSPRPQRQSALVSSSTTTWFNPVENPLFSPKFRVTPAVVNAGITGIKVEPQLWAARSLAITSNAGKNFMDHYPGQVLRLFKDLFSWQGHENSLNAAKSVVVVRANRAINPEGKTIASGQQKRPAFLHTAFIQNFSSHSSHRTVFQVWVKGYLIAELPARDQAELVASRFKQILQNPHFDAAQLQVGLTQGNPAGKLGDRILFAVDPAIAAHMNRTRELLAVEWVNNLRIALSTPPLTLAEAQAKMYGLVETDRKIEGLASWYGPYFHGRLTATGETFNQNELTAAHPSLPFDTYLKVTNLNSGHSVIVRINDRGPYVDNRVLDLSREAARQINSEDAGVISFQAVIMRPNGSQRLATGSQLTAGL
uniref:septal ring lytic transglycosylase RlpA family protein n=1 Tax=Trichocoleus desertorum TaxID=1481672 RepID=UPI0025B4FDBD|nr:septal ring lytic transglycosylase RlpA family protein [Trichocoleus desertorum]